MDRDDLSASSFPKSVQSYTKFEGNRCTLPMLADVYGLYYNKDLLAKAGITEPPKTFSELTDDAKKLTAAQRPTASIEVAGYVPTWGFYENQAAHYAPQFGAHWTDERRASPRSSTDPAGRRCINWSEGPGRLVRLRQARALPGRRRATSSRPRTPSSAGRSR